MDSATTLALVVAALAGSVLAAELAARLIMSAGRLRAPYLPGVRGLVVAATVLAALGRAPAQAAVPPPSLWLERPVGPLGSAAPSLDEVRVAGEAHYQVQPGDSLWGIAARSLRGERAEPPVAAEVDRLWRAIYAANRDVVGPDPNLIHPGQRLVIPLEA